jgi:arylsulfatase A-like enzyme
MSRLSKCSDYIWQGALHGAAAWSAYALVEFAFTSLLFRLTRPYSGFTGWHWNLTALLLVGFLVVGLTLGSAAGFLLWRFRNAGTIRVRPVRALELAVSLTLVSAFLLNEILTQGLQHQGVWLQFASLVFIGLLLSGLRSLPWMDRPGLLTNYWVISGLLLGLGQWTILLEAGSATQLGAPITLGTQLAFAMLIATVLLALWAGRGGRFAANRWITFGSVTLGLALLAASVALSFAGHTTVHAASLGPSNSSRPNVILIVMDTVRADHISALGYQRNTTPNLKRLAADAVVYSNAVSASDITITSHASLFTGMYPSWHGSYCQPPEALYGRELGKKFPTIAELLRKNGYQTVGVAANLYLRSDFGLERGFDEFRIPRPVPLLPDQTGYLLRRALRRGLSLVIDTAQFDRLYALGEDVDLTLFSTLDHRSRRDAPLFVFLNYMDSHFPYVPPAPYNVAFAGWRPRITQDILEEEQTQITRGQGEPPGYRAHCESEYDGAIVYMDAQIGKVIEWLKRENAYDNTMIVVTADHGESFGERNRVGHANSPYQNLLHVPLLVKYPHNARRGVEDRLVSLIDVAPTILEIAQVPLPGTIQGRPVTTPSETRAVYAETFPCPVMQPPECPRGCSAKAVFAWPMKYIASGSGKRELFDLSSDPDEKTNLFIQQRELATHLDAVLTDWKKNLPTQTRQNKQVDPEKLKQLQGLGYIQ